ncbi:MAG TPA: putative sulfate exporter family transporter, partial [Fimbriimonadaceae bacterium]|nr:putative sulfate exporter family transporter [Fimbriimonadaceae bacterium]
WWIRRNSTAHPAEGKTASPFPYFILGFIAASMLRTYIPVIGEQATNIKTIASIGLAVALYLIGSGITRKTLQQVGVKPLVQGVTLWLFISVAAFLAVRTI